MATQAGPRKALLLLRPVRNVVGAPHDRWVCGSGSGSFTTCSYYIDHRTRLRRSTPKPLPSHNLLPPPPSRSCRTAVLRTCGAACIT